MRCKRFFALFSVFYFGKYSGSGELAAERGRCAKNRGQPLEIAIKNRVRMTDADPREGITTQNGTPAGDKCSA